MQGDREAIIRYNSGSQGLRFRATELEISFGVIGGKFWNRQL